MNVDSENRPHVLIIDDEPDTADVFRRLLEVKLSANTTVSTNRDEARKLLEETHFDLVTLDYQLSDGYTLDLLSEIASRESHPPVIIVTGHGDEEIASLAFRNGAAGYVVKNDTLSHNLIEAAKKALGDFVLMKAVEAVRESEAFYRSLFFESAQALFIEDPDGVIEDANRAAYTMLGYEKGELVGKNILELTPAGSEPPDYKATATAERTPSEILNSNGEAIPVELSVNELLTRRGLRFVVERKDVREAVLARRAFDDEKAFTENILNAMRDIFIAFNLFGQVYKWNRSLTEITSWTDDEISQMGKSVNFFLPEDFSRMKALIDKVAETRKSCTIEASVATKGGRSIPYELTGSLLLNHKREPMGVACIGRDISERKRSEEALMKMLKETNERREEISALLETTSLVLKQKDFNTAAKEIFELGRNLVEAEIASMILFEDGGQDWDVLFIEPESNRERLGFLAGKSVPDLMSDHFRLGKTEYYNDFQSTRWAPLVPEDAIRIETLLIAPLMIGETLAGATFFANKPGGFTGRDTTMAAAFGEILSLALRDFRNMQALTTSEEQFRSVAETAMEAVICADGNAKITFWNASAEKTFGYSSEEMHGRPLVDILPPEIREERKQVILRDAADDSSIGLMTEMTGQRKNGQSFPMELSRSKWKVGDDSFFAVIAKDITDRKHAEEVLRNSEELYRTLLHASPDAIMVFDLENNIQEISGATLELLGYSDPSEIVGKSYLDLLPQSEERRAEAMISEVFENGFVINVELGLCRKDDTMIIGEVNSSVLRDRNGQPSGRIDVIRDVTKRRQEERELQLLNNELEGYAHVVSHDLKGPLSSMMAASIALKGLSKGPWDEPSVKAAHELVSIIESNVKKSSLLIDDILDLAGAGQRPRDIADVDMASVIDQVLSERNHEIKKRRIKVVTSDQLGSIAANETHMYQLFANLIQNMIQHNDNRRPVIQISYLGDSNDGAHRYRIQDNGSGIDPEILDYIFVPFFSGGHSGTGIGLATVEKIVKVYGGTITASNRGGACFDFFLYDYSPQLEKSLYDTEAARR